jgi:hypothetical protein
MTIPVAIPDRDPSLKPFDVDAPVVCVDNVPVACADDVAVASGDEPAAVFVMVAKADGCKGGFKFGIEVVT